MSQYTFHTLSDADFEELTGDLLSKELGTQLQSFTKGPDGGIDLLHGTGTQQALIVQCKHYSGSSFSSLKSKLRKEQERINRLAPSRYILATSCGLTPENKEEIKRILSPHIKSLADIYGKDELNSLLRKYPEVERCHFKLWFASTEVLQRVLHNAEAAWEHLETDAIQHALKIYVHTKAEGEALKLLDERGSCVLSGAPGAGKTTLARVLSSRLADGEYKVIFVRDDIEQALKLLDLSAKQVIYYDDFLGRTDLSEKRDRDDGNVVVQLLKKARKSSNTKLILTTREYILQEAYGKYERLTKPDVELSKCVVDIAKYTTVQRARLLYNHLYFSRLSRAHIKELVSSEAYGDLIRHENFNPRLIEWMTNPEGGVPESPQGYVQQFFNAIENPERIWEIPYNQHLTIGGRLLLQVLATFTGLVEVESLFLAWVHAHEPEEISHIPSERESEFSRLLKVLDGSFVTVQKSSRCTGVDFENPSIRDFVRLKLSESVAQRKYLLQRAQYFEQLKTLALLTSEGKIGPEPDSSALTLSDCTNVLKRTVTVPNPTLYRFVRDWPQSREEYLDKRGVDLGNRLLEVNEWAVALDPFSPTSIIEDLSEQVLNTKDAKDYLSVEILPLVGNWLDNDSRPSEMTLALIQRVVNRVSEYSDIQEWLKLGRFLSVYGRGELNVHTDQLRHGAEAMWDSEVDYALHDAKESYHVEEVLDMHDEFGRVWNIDTSYRKEDLEERLIELAHGEDSKFDAYRDDRMLEDDEPAFDIDALFQSLLDRPE